MTTIAYKNGIIAYDSRLVLDNLIYDDDFDKKIEVDGALFFMSGTVSDFPEFIAAYFGKSNNRASLDVESFVFHNGSLYRSSVDEKGVFWKSPLRRENSYAIGSGSHFALAFMDSGYYAESAVKATIKRDCWTGGKVNTFVLP